MVGGVKGGRSTFGICFGVLSWAIEEGRVGDVDVSGLATALVVRYDDDEPGSPWSIVLHDEPFAWELSGNCAFASDFDYASG